MKRAFTLVELLVVISIISVLASMALVNIDGARARARDAARSETVHNIGLAIELYRSNNNGNSPGCQAVSENPPTTAAQVSGCFAVSTAGVNTDERAAWESLKTDLQPYLSSIPDDPCGSSCTSDSGLPIGYTYSSPYAMQYYCGTNCPYSADQLNQMYQLYAPLENSTNPSTGGSSSGVGSGGSGSGSGSGNFNNPNLMPVINLSSSGTLVNNYVVSYTTTNASSCTMTRSDNANTYNLTLPSGTIIHLSVGTVVRVTCTGTGGTSSAQVTVSSNQGGVN